MPISLKTAIKSSYGDKKSKQKILDQGYVKDKKLSNANQKVFYNKDTGNLLFNVAGSRTAKDFLYTDPMLALGRLKSTNRYKEADKALKQPKKFIILLILQLQVIALVVQLMLEFQVKKISFLGFNPGYTIGQKTRRKDSKRFIEQRVILFLF
jgi:hypothetical protein